MRLIGLALLGLAGCVSVEQNAAACEASGYTKGTEPFDWCMIKREEAQKDEASFRGAAIGEVIGNYGEQISRAPQIAAPPRQPMSCTSNVVGGYVYTNCY